MLTATPHIKRFYYSIIVGTVVLIVLAAVLGNPFLIFAAECMVVGLAGVMIARTRRTVTDKDMPGSEWQVILRNLHEETIDLWYSNEREWHQEVAFSVGFTGALATLLTLLPTPVVEEKVAEIVMLGIISVFLPLGIKHGSYRRFKIDSRCNDAHGLDRLVGVC